MNPWATMTDREKDALIAEHVLGCEMIWRDVLWKAPDGTLYFTGDDANKPRTPHTAFHPTVDRNAFAEVETALEQRGSEVRNRYVEAIIDLVSYVDEGVHSVPYFRMITASLDVRCKAALRACGVEVA